MIFSIDLGWCLRIKLSAQPEKELRLCASVSAEQNTVEGEGGGGGEVEYDIRSPAPLQIEPGADQEVLDRYTIYNFPT